MVSGQGQISPACDSGDDWSGRSCQSRRVLCACNIHSQAHLDAPGKDPASRPYPPGPASSSATRPLHRPVTKRETIMSVFMPKTRLHWICTPRTKVEQDTITTPNNPQNLFKCNKVLSWLSARMIRHWTRGNSCSGRIDSLLACTGHHESVSDYTICVTGIVQRQGWWSQPSN